MTSIVCDDSNSVGDVGTRTATFHLEAGETIKCTFTDTEQPRLRVVKVLIPPSDTGLFNLRIDGVVKASDVGEGGTTGWQYVSIGSHTVSETAGTGTDLANYVKIIVGHCALDGSVSLAAGEEKTCAITNTRKGTIIVEKQTLPDGAAGSFTFTGDAAGTISDNGQITVQNLIPGTYSSTESDPSPAFDLTSIVCDDGSSLRASSGNVETRTATFRLDPGETVKCTFTNTKRGHIIIIKDAQPNDLQDFTFIKRPITGMYDTFYLDDDAGVVGGDNTRPNQVDMEVAPGTWTVNEWVPNVFWTNTAINCDDPTSDTTVNLPTHQATIIVAPGETVTCTFVNVKPMPTRTLGFWKTHWQYTELVFNSKLSSDPFTWTSDGQIILGDGTTHTKTIGSPNAMSKLLGTWYSNTAKTSFGVKRTPLDQARVQLAHQLVAAILNCASFGCDSATQTLINNANTAYGSTDPNVVKSYIGPLDAYNNSGDTLIIDYQGRADPKGAAALATSGGGIEFWNWTAT